MFSSSVFFKKRFQDFLPVPRILGAGSRFAVIDDLQQIFHKRNLENERNKSNFRLRVPMKKKEKPRFQFVTLIVDVPPDLET